MSYENTDSVQMQGMSFYAIILYSLVKIQNLKTCTPVKYHGRGQIFIFNVVSLSSFM